MLPEPHQYWCGSGKPPQRTLWEGAQAAGIVRLTRVGMLLRGVAFAPITYNVLANEAGQRGGSIDTRSSHVGGSEWRHVHSHCPPDRFLRARIIEIELVRHRSVLVSHC